MYIKRVHFNLFFENYGGIAGLADNRGGRIRKVSQ